MKKYHIVSYILTMILFVGCEEIIKIDLEGTDARLVIEGKITDGPGPHTVRISRSTDYFDPEEYPMVSGALVVISDDTGLRDTLQEVAAGIYQTTFLTGETGRNYTLETIVEGEQYIGTATMQDRIEIDSIELEYYPATPYYEEGYWLHCHFTDPAGEGNYYRTKVFKNGTTDKNLYIIDDKFIDGNPVDLFVWGDFYIPNDTAWFELWTMDEYVYDYFYTLANLLYSGGDGSYATPANPNTNLSDGALGYFGAFTIARDTIIVPDYPEQSR
ncbi:MAG: DUF4249 domain-containing protein [Bacteroidales bacterium]|nr:MAG: DUF4249 domain-containing protein [Bacteroidales bacterium]